MEANEYKIKWSEMTEDMTLFSGVKQVAIVLYYKGLVTHEQCAFCVRTGFIPNEIYTAGLDPLFERGVVLDRCEDAFAFLAMRVLFRDMTLFN